MGVINQHTGEGDLASAYCMCFYRHPPSSDHWNMAFTSRFPFVFEQLTPKVYPRLSTSFLSSIDIAIKCSIIHRLSTWYSHDYRSLLIIIDYHPLIIINYHPCSIDPQIIHMIFPWSWWKYIEIIIVHMSSASIFIIPWWPEWPGAFGGRDGPGPSLHSLRDLSP